VFHRNSFALGLIAKFPDAEIIGIDASEGMMKVGKSKADALGVNIKFQKGDATKLPFEDNSFDIAIISFGLRNLPTLEDGLKEMQRVVKPGGMVSNIDQGKPTNFIFHLAYKLYFCSIAPIIGKLVFHRGEFTPVAFLSIRLQV
jgi:demethylmenaquinone methyltransferase/2-methoxy-6-polyprenyl-1,4-benzoquinol methylase